MSDVKTVLFMFAQLDPLDNVPVTDISKIEKVDNRLHFHVLKDGNNTVITKPATPFIMNQIDGFQIPFYE